MTKKKQKYSREIAVSVQFKWLQN